MEKLSPKRPVVQSRVESQNPLWIITVMLAVFAVCAAALVAWG